MEEETYRLDAVDLITDERNRQVILGYNTENDLQYTNNELLQAAISYIYACGEDKVSMDAAVEIWPWEYSFKPSDRVRNLEKAGALIAAEIDRHVASQQN